MLRFTRAALTAATALLAVTFFGSTARADVTDLRGAWMGFRQSSGLANPPDPDRSFFEITSQNGRRFTGRVMIDPCWFPVDGTISASGMLDATGFHENHHVVIHGRVSKLGVGADLPTAPCRVTALTYKITGPDHSVDDSGFLILLQMQGGPGWTTPPDPEDVSGHWAGDFSSSVGPGGGGFEMDLRQIRAGGGIDEIGGITSGFTGVIRMNNVFVSPPDPDRIGSFFDVFLEVDGTVGRPVLIGGSMTSNVAVIGLGNPPVGDKSGRIIAILSGLMTASEPNEVEPYWDVQYSLYGSFFDIFTEITTGRSTSFNMGSAHAMFMPNRG